MKVQEFIQRYEAHLREAIAANPREYSPFINPRTTAEKMAAAIKAGTFSHTDASALKALCAEIGIRPYTRRVIQDWFEQHVEWEARRGKTPQRH